MSSFIFIGGDKRMLYAAEKLGRAYLCGFEKLTSCTDIYNEARLYDYAVLPLQKSADGLTIPCPFSEQDIPYEILGKILKKGGIVFTGNICGCLEKICAENGFALVNYLEREELAVMNAVPTAEGALAIAVNELPVTVFGADILITGYGRIAKILAKYLTVMGARVSVACRKPHDRRWAEINGCKTVDITDKSNFTAAVSEAVVIFNTVPYGIFGNAEASAMKENALYIELASRDGIGAELPESVKLITARGLPGKTAPVTAGEIIADTIVTVLSEERGK